MKRMLIVLVALALAASALTAWSAAAPSTAGGAESAAAKLPPLPANIKQRGRWNIGVKCDVPPFGYINVKGQNAGFDVEIAKWFARYAFGKASRVNYTCAPTPAREPLLTTDRVDLVISTFTYNQDRDMRIDFSRAYFKAAGKLLVPNNGPVQKLSDINGRTIATTSASIYHKWMQNCFKEATPLVFDSFANAVLALRGGRADAVMWDDTAVLGIATTDSSLKLTPDTFLPGPYGIGIKQGNVALKRWVDARLNLMKKKDIFIRILRNNVPARLVPAFSDSVLRPKNNFGYAAVDPTTVCP
ncbi:MAG TPA: transporter substrate-binding domain-containing protein [Gaiellaceae bacterium]|nr:transporter substrate-binding domain-containing protein [Gaiellaceae bacterium]